VVFGNTVSRPASAGALIKRADAQGYKAQAEAVIVASAERFNLALSRPKLGFCVNLF